MSITTRAAIARGPHIGWEIADLQLDEPKAHEVRVKFYAAGLCHSDNHVTKGDARPRFPIVGGHEGAGIVESVGPDVRRVKVGDRLICSYIPACGACRPCVTGHQNMCVKGLNAGTGMFLDGTFRFHLGDEDLGGFCTLGTFSQYAVVSEWACVPVADDIPWEVACLVGCGVPTGWGSAVYAAGVQPGETVLIYGIGGIGINAVQGARHAGARYIVAVDPIEFKREMADELGATHSVASAGEAHELVLQLTHGVGADNAIVTAGVVTEDVVEAGFNAIRKGGTVTVTGLGNIADKTIHLSGTMLTLFQKRVQGTLFGSANPMYDIKKMLDLYRTGDVKLDELVTRTYRLEEINQGYQDLIDGRNIRGVILHEH